MIVKEVIDELSKMPLESEVNMLFDGTAGTSVGCVWIAKGGHVVISGFDEVVYEDVDRPLGSPNEEENLFWSSPESQKEDYECNK